MGINAIKCEGYSNAKESGFGSGQESASDFVGDDLIKYGIYGLIGASVSLGALVIGSIIAEYRELQVNIENGNYKELILKGEKDSREIYDKSTGRSYRIELGVTTEE